MKKFLSLVLALIMTMSLVTISAGATEYRDLTDKEEIQYAEAVAVLNRIGVITGYEDGSFRPETELTRGAAAKIIVSLMIGPDAASALPNNASPYPDVPAGHTFAGVIGYCKTAGYISGYGDGTFKPANPLTGYAFAKMLLGAVGYKSNIEGFVDTGWTMNVARIGNVAGLFDRLDFDGAAAVTRDEACQLALNTLKATMVDYGGSNTVVSSTGEVLTVQGSKAQYVTSNNREINANINRRVINAVNNEMTLEFGEEHFKDLRLEHDKYDPAYDVYGHPSNEWSYKKVTIGTFKLPADFTYTNQIVHREASVASKEKALGLRGYDTYSTDHRDNYSSWSTPSSGLRDYRSPFADATQIHINGWNARAFNKDYTQTPVPAGESAGEGQLYTYNARDIEKATKTQAPSLSEIADLTDNGVTVEVYVCPVDADFITDVVVTRTQLMEVDRVASDYIRLKDVEPDSRSPYDNADLGAITGYNAFAIDGTEWANKAINDVKDDNYDAYKVLKDMKAGDYVAVVPYTADDGDTWEVGEAYAPEVVSGTLTRVDIYNSEKKKDGNAVAITVGGTSYPINEWNKDMMDITANSIKATRKDVDLYLAKDGTALWVDEVGNLGDWMVVADYYQGTNDAGKVVWYVHGYTTGGDEINLDLGTIRGAAERYAPGELVRYALNTTTGGGEYLLEKPNFNQASVKKSGMYSNMTTPVNTPVYPNAQGDTATTFGERAMSTTNHEGVYRVALAYSDTAGTSNYDYEVKKGLDWISLDRFDTANLDNVSVADSKVPPTNTENVADTRGYVWQVNTLYYASNPTFIYVSFDKTGEIETIYFTKGRQDIRNEDLRHFNSAWRNAATNTDDFVASTAEAYVNDKNQVETVVIKTDSADASLDGIRIITKNTGSNNYVKYVGAEGETTSLTGKWNEREYVQGPDFKEMKTGVFDKGWDVGDILVGNEKDGIFYAKEFHGDEYRGNSLDGFMVRGIDVVESKAGKKLDDVFKIPATASVYTLNGSTLTANNGLAQFNRLMNAEDEPEHNTDLQPLKEAGLIRCVNAKIVDVRVGHEGEITKLKDLLDDKKFDFDNITLKVLLNGKFGDDGFRNAYVVVIMDTKDPVKRAEEPKFDLEVATNGEGDWDLEEEFFTVTKGEKVTLTADLTNADKLTSVTYDWSAKDNADDSAFKLKASKNEAVFTASKVGEFTVTVKVTNSDGKNADNVVTKSIKIKVEDTKVAGQGTVKFAEALATDFSILGKPIFKLTEEGVPTVVFRFANPEYVSGATAFSSLKFQIKDTEGTVLFDDTMIGDVKSDATFGATGSSYIMGSTKQAAMQPLLAGQDVEDLVIEITEVKYNNYDLKVVAPDGTEYKGAEIASSVYAGTRGAAAVNKVLATGEAVTVKFAGADSGELKATVSGATAAVAAVTLNKGNTWTASTASVTPDGKGYVTVTLTEEEPLVTLNRVTTAADIVNDLADVEIAGTAYGGSANAITYSITPSDGVTSSTEKVYIDITLTSPIAASASAVKLNYQLKNAAGEVKDTFSVTFKNGYKANGDPTDVVTARYTLSSLTESLKLSLASAEKVSAPKIRAVGDIEKAGATWANGDTFKVYFTEAVDTGVAGATLTLPSVDSQTLTAVIDTDGDFATVTVGGAISTAGDSAVTFTKMQSVDGIAFAGTQKLSFTDSSVELA